MFKNLRLIITWDFYQAARRRIDHTAQSTTNGIIDQVDAAAPTEVPLPIKVHGHRCSEKMQRVYELPPRQHSERRFTAAGGATDSAAMDKLNLAAKLNDGQQVVVGETVTAAQPSTNNQPPAEQPISQHQHRHARTTANTPQSWHGDSATHYRVSNQERTLHAHRRHSKKFPALAMPLTPHSHH